MEAQDFRSLQEAYMRVYSVDEGLIKYPWGKVVKQINKKMKSDPESAQELKKRHERLRDLTSNELGKPKYRLQSSEKKSKEKSRNEELDIYDIILSHLLDEGYAETPEAAEAIMVNMSEEWRVER